MIDRLNIWPDSVLIGGFALWVGFDCHFVEPGQQSMEGYLLLAQLLALTFPRYPSTSCFNSRV